MGKLRVKRLLLRTGGGHARHLEGTLRSLEVMLLVNVHLRLRVVHLRVLLGLTVHHLSGVRVERLLEHLRPLGAILGTRHLHRNVGLLLVVAGDVQAMHV